MDRRQFSADVVLIATHTSYKEEVMRDLIRLRPQLNLRIWGNLWRERCHSASFLPAAFRALRFMEARTYAHYVPLAYVWR